MERENVFWIYLLVFFSTGVCSNYKGQEDVGCQPPWEQVHRACVLFVKDVHRSWQDARAYCTTVHADLLSISDNEKLRKLKPILKKHITVLSLIEWWIGLQHLIDQEVPWTWVDGESLVSNLPPWLPGEPNNGRSHEHRDTSETASEDCAVLNFQSSLKDMNCLIKKPFVCEQLKTTAPPSFSTFSTTASYETNAPAAASSNALQSTTSTILSTSSALTTSETHPYQFHKRSTLKTINTSTPSTTTSAFGTVSFESGSTAVMETQTDYNHDNVTKQPTIGATNVTDFANTTKPSQEEFERCYSVNLESACPPVEAFGISWPRTEAGKTATVQCDKGQAKWKCQAHPTCWHDQPDIKQCTSDNIQKLTEMMEDVMTDPGNSNKAVTFTESLVATITNVHSLSEQDLFQSTKLMLSVAKVKIHNSSDAKKILENVIKCGSSLVSKEKSNTWTSMKNENRRIVASTLLLSLESVTMAMLNAFNEPTIEIINSENLEVQLNVMDVDKFTSSKDIVYQNGVNSFTMPSANLKLCSTGGLARLMFINYLNLGNFLTPEEENPGTDMERKVISGVTGASIGYKNTTDSLLQPFTYTFKTARGGNEDWKQLCSFWNFSLRYSGAWSQNGCSLLRYNATHTTCQCTHLTNFAILMDVYKTKMAEVDVTTLSYITYVGIITSIICLFLSWMTFICLSSVQGERNSIHTHLVFCLFISEALFLAGIERTDHKVACALIAGFLHYFFLSTFTWMFLEGIHILFMLVQVFDSAQSRLKYYYIIGYGCPLLTVTVSAAVLHEGYGTEKYCWLTTERMFIWSFAGPVALILLVNLMVLIYAMSAVCKHSEYVFNKEKSKSGNLKFVVVPAFAMQTQKRLKRNRAWIQGALSIEVLLGLTWVFGYFYVSEDTVAMAYLFTVFNSLQGAFIFVCHCLLNKKVLKEYQRFIGYKKTPGLSTANSSSKAGSGSAPNIDSSLNMAACRKQSDFLEVHKPEPPPLTNYSIST